MFTDFMRRAFKWFLDPVSRALGNAGISPNALTIIGFAMSAGVAYLLASGRFFWGAIVLLFASAFDGLDGALARNANRITQFGAFLDSTLDRYSEALVYLGLVFYFGRAGQITLLILCYVTIIGSILVSYTRARAEGLGIACKEGLLTRVERVAVLILFLFINRLDIGLWILAILANVTALQRIYVVWRKADAKLPAVAPTNPPQT